MQATASKTAEGIQVNPFPIDLKATSDQIEAADLSNSGRQKIMNVLGDIEKALAEINKEVLPISPDALLANDEMFERTLGLPFAKILSDYYTSLEVKMRRIAGQLEEGVFNDSRVNTSFFDSIYEILEWMYLAEHSLENAHFIDSFRTSIREELEACSDCYSHASPTKLRRSNEIGKHLAASDVRAGQLNSLIGLFDSFNIKALSPEEKESIVDCIFSISYSDELRNRLILEFSEDERGSKKDKNSKENFKTFLSLLLDEKQDVFKSLGLSKEKIVHFLVNHLNSPQDERGDAAFYRLENLLNSSIKEALNPSSSEKSLEVAALSLASDGHCLDAFDLPQNSSERKSIYRQFVIEQLLRSTPSLLAEVLKKSPFLEVLSDLNEASSEEVRELLFKSKMVSLTKDTLHYMQNHLAAQQLMPLDSFSGVEPGEFEDEKLELLLVIFKYIIDVMGDALTQRNLFLDKIFLTHQSSESSA